MDVYFSISACTIVCIFFFSNSTIIRFRKKELIVWFFEPNREYFAAIGDSNVSNNTISYTNAFMMAAFCHQQHLQLATKWKFT